MSFMVSQSLLKLMSIELVMPSNHLILCYPLLLLPLVFPIIRTFPMSQFFASGGNAGDPGSIPRQENPLKETANNSSLLAWRIPWTEEPGGL